MVKGWIVGAVLVGAIGLSGCGSTSATTTANSVAGSEGSTPSVSSSPPANSTPSPATAASLKECFRARGLTTSGNVNNVVETRGGNFEVEFPKGSVVFLMTGSDAEAKRAVAGEIALAEAYGVDASDLVVQAGNVVYFWDGTFRHDEAAIDACVAQDG
jgi:hypothetical protein